MSDAKNRQGFTFNDDEVLAMSQVLSLLYRGGDAKVMIRSKEVRGMAKRFNERAEKIRAAEGNKVLAGAGA